jgi:hypothetical protein
MDLYPIGSTFDKLGLRWEVVGHKMQNGKLVEDLRMIGPSPKGGSKARVDQSHTSGGVSQASTITEKALPGRRRTGTTRKSYGRPIVARRAGSGPPVAGIVLVVAVILACLALAGLSGQPSYVGPALPARGK